MPYGSSHLRPDDLYLVHVAVLDKATHETILPHLQIACERAGPPGVLLSDGGTDVVKAVKAFGQHHPQMTHVLDIAHAGANVLKNRWTAQPRWKDFLSLLTQTNQKLRQTPLAYLVSPRLRDKGRFMSVGVVLRFARRVLYWLDQGEAPLEAQQKYGWLLGFRHELRQWSHEQQLVQHTIHLARCHGWSTGTMLSLETLWKQKPPEGANNEVVQPLRDFAQKMCAQVKRGQWLAASTETIESAFGRWKRFLEAGPNQGLSALVLALAVVFKPVPPEQTQQALEQTPVKKVFSWVRRQLGTTLRKLRRWFTRQTSAALP
jgi:hypothetical protein